MKNIIYHPILLKFHHLIIFFLECSIAQGMIFKGKRIGIIHNFTMNVDAGYECIEKFRGGVQWYMMESKDTISSIRFKLINGNRNLILINGPNHLHSGYQSKKFHSYNRQEQ